jgi:chaperonin GroES
MSKSKLRPLKDRVVVRRLAPETTTAGGIIIPDSAKERPQRAVVLAVGSGSVNQEGVVKPLEVKVNDVVLFGKYGGVEVQDDSGEELLILREDDILAVLAA